MTNVAVTTGGLVLDISAAGSDTSFYFTYIDGNVYARLNDSPAAGSAGAPGTKIGHWVVNRTGASANSIYQNGTLFFAINQTSAGAVGNGPFFVLSDGGGVGNPNTVSVASMGASLTTGQISNFNSRLSTYLSFPAAGATILMGQAML